MAVTRENNMEKTKSINELKINLKVSIAFNYILSICVGILTALLWH